MSTFNSDEVEFLKSRGNVWCSKVWLGLYDKKSAGALDISKDEDSLKYHILQKYEKKRYLLVIFKGSLRLRFL
jgi:Arf-GAP domain and FG repeat-containing protein 1